MKSFQDQVAIITGGAGGLGQAVAEVFAEEGIKGLVIADVNRPASHAYHQRIVQLIKCVDRLMATTSRPGIRYFIFTPPTRGSSKQNAQQWVKVQ